MLAALFGLFGCAVSYDASGRRCDSEGRCLVGFVCIDNMCVRRGALEAGPGATTDAATDTWTPSHDAGTDDSGPSDGAPTDAHRDGAPSDAREDAGPHDAGHDTGSGSFCDRHAGALFCTDFEGEPPTEWKVSDGTEARLSNLRARSGTQSFRGELDLPAPHENEEAGIEYFAASPWQSGSLYVRVSIFIESSSSFTRQFIVAQLWDPEQRNKVSLDVQESYRFFLNNEFGNNAAGMEGGVPVDEWFCFELAVDLDPAAGRVRLQVDDGPVIQTDESATRGTSFPSLFLGGNLISNSSAERLFFHMDDVVIDDEPIGCAP